MLKRTITYPDLDGVMHTEDFYFNLNQSEIVEFEAMTKHGLSKTLKRAMEEEDRSVIIPIVKELILRSYGQKSFDGKRFVKNQELRDDFYQSEAYNLLFMELMQSVEAQQAFVVGVMPAAMKTTIIDALKEETPPSLPSNA